MSKKLDEEIAIEHDIQGCLNYITSLEMDVKKQGGKDLLKLMRGHCATPSRFW